MAYGSSFLYYPAPGGSGAEDGSTYSPAAFSSARSCGNTHSRAVPLIHATKGTAGKNPFRGILVALIAVCTLAAPVFGFPWNTLLPGRQERGFEQGRFPPRDQGQTGQSRQMNQTGQAGQSGRIGPFLITAGFNLVEIKTELDSVGNIYSEISRILKLPPIREEIEIRIFTNESEWKEFFRNNIPNTQYRRAMYIRKETLLDKKRGKIYLYRSPRLGNDMRHECTHALLAASLGKSVPIWLDEGLAEYYEIPSDRINNPDWLERTRNRIQSGALEDIQALEKVEGMDRMTKDRYGDAWAWVCYLLNGPIQIRDVLPSYFNDLAQRRLFPASVSRRLAGQGTCRDPGFRRFYGI